jgi:L-rhamnose mutarotase
MSREGAPSLERVGFRLQLNLATLEEYVQVHESVWPEMTAALSQAGWRNYSLFLDRTDGSLFGYFESSDAQASIEAMKGLEVNVRWQREMAHFFDGLNGRNPDDGFLTLENVFFLA